MRKLYLLLLMILTVINVSCNNNNDCETCNLPEHKTIVSNFLGENVELKVYEGKSNYSDFLYKDEKSFIYLQNYLENLDIELSSIVAVSFYINSKIDYRIVKLSDVKGFIIYEKFNNDFMRVKIFKRDGDLLKESAFSNFETNMITSNDIYGVSKILFDTTSEVSPISFINYSALPNIKYKSQFQQEVASRLLSTMRGEGERCSQPCPETKGFCTASEHQSGGERWNCNPNECPKDDVDEKTVDQSTARYGILEMNIKLRSFRDSYLINTKGGQRIIALYYSLNIPKDRLTLDFCLRTLDFINVVVLPLAENLQNNPQQQTILINNSDKTIILDYLNAAKILYEDNDDKENIDLIIDEIKFLSNKSNAEITSYLSNM